MGHIHKTNMLPNIYYMDFKGWEWKCQNNFQPLNDNLKDLWLKCLDFFCLRLQHKASNSQIWICFEKLMSLWYLMSHNLTILGFLHFSILMQVQHIIKYIIGMKEAFPSNFKLWFELVNLWLIDEPRMAPNAFIAFLIGLCTLIWPKFWL